MSVKTPEEIETMREGGRRLARILNGLAAEVKPGVRPTDLSATAREQIKKAGMQPVVLGYEGFPDVLCVSVNECIVHGVPGKEPFRHGDVVKVDLTLGYKGLILDSAVTVVAGNSDDPDVKRLINGTKEALAVGIAAIRGDGTRVGDISAAVQDALNKCKLGIIRDLVGHGLGYEIHEEPNIPNYGVAGTGPVLHAGSTIAIEPMASLGDWQIGMLKNGGVIMRDGSLGAHFEHTVLVTENGAEILTQP
ncbi:MAG TPA: type I methionyl aminopeptidase [Candidatus Nitrosopolaris sp.]|nr:type I methionyl aminopeptidase [Candidatus Nitrosopolaris sp.]